jgi:hypothetical protein
MKYNESHTHHWPILVLCQRGTVENLEFQQFSPATAVLERPAKKAPAIDQINR